MLNLNTLAEEYTKRLHDIFITKEWFNYGQNVNDIFDCFCNRLSRLEDNDQRDLILELTEEYTWIPSSKYETCLTESLKELFDGERTLLTDEDIKKILICPLIPEDNEKIKSGTYISYLCQSVLIQTLTKFKTHKVQIRTIEELKDERNKKNRESDLIILVDDYIGSGQTGFECLSKLGGKDIGITPERNKIVILSLVAQEEGITQLEGANVKVYCYKKRKKAITDYYEKEEAERKRRIMKAISHVFGVKDNMELGFEQTEGLVTMIRTPNNTFPFFWKEEGKNKDAPFSRQKLYYPLPKEKEDQ